MLWVLGHEGFLIHKGQGLGVAHLGGIASRLGMRHWYCACSGLKGTRAGPPQVDRIWGI